jgi:uncharacterized protein YukE
MSETTGLLSALRDYSDAIDRHFAMLRERYEHLSGVWAPTRDLYQGAGAEAFAEAMQRATARFQEMIEAEGQIQTILKTKIADLGRYASPSLPDDPG